MDIASDTAHLYDDAKFNDECVRLDVKNQQETKQQNRRVSMGLAFASQVIDRQKALIQKEYNREMRLIKDGLEDIYVKTPYFQSFWKVNEEEAKRAVIDRLIGSRRKNRRTKDLVTIETVPEDDVMDIRQSSISKGQADGSKPFRPVRRTKSEPVSSREECSTSGSSRSAHYGRMRSSSLSALLNVDRHRTNSSTSEASSYTLPRIDSRLMSNKDLLKYEPIMITKPIMPKRLVPISSTEEVELTGRHAKTRAHGYVRAAKYHSKSLDRVYLRRSTSNNLVVEEVPTESTGFEFSELPDNPILRAHFICQANSRRRVSGSEAENGSL